MGCLVGARYLCILHCDSHAVTCATCISCVPHMHPLTPPTTGRDEEARTAFKCSRRTIDVAAQLQQRLLSDDNADLQEGMPGELTAAFAQLGSYSALVVSAAIEGSSDFQAKVGCWGCWVRVRVCVGGVEGAACSLAGSIVCSHRLYIACTMFAAHDGHVHTTASQATGNQPWVDTGILEPQAVTHQHLLTAPSLRHHLCSLPLLPPCRCSTRTR